MWRMRVGNSALNGRQNWLSGMFGVLKWNVSLCRDQRKCLHRPPSVLLTEGTIHSSVSKEKYECLKKKKKIWDHLCQFLPCCVFQRCSLPPLVLKFRNTVVRRGRDDLAASWTGRSVVFCGIYEFPFQKLCRCVAVPVYPSLGSTYCSVKSQSTSERVLRTKRKPLLSEKTLWEELCPKPQNLVLLSCDNFVRL